MGWAIAHGTRRLAEVRGFCFKQQTSVWFGPGLPVSHVTARKQWGKLVRRQWTVAGIVRANMASTDPSQAQLSLRESVSGRGMVFRKGEKLPWAGRMCHGSHRSVERCHGFRWTVSSKNHSRHQILSPNWTRRCYPGCSASRSSEFWTILVHLKLAVTEKQEGPVRRG